MNGLTTHVLDTSSGKPGANLYFRLFRLGVELQNPARLELLNGRTNADGRYEAPLLDEESMQVGQYELEFHVADYFRRQGVNLSDPPFLDQVVIRFAIADTRQHYHVPLLVSPYGYTTYRGS
jgi:5-hydroxyisourate hydrolase